jgi:hypothetical protein
MMMIIKAANSNVLPAINLAELMIEIVKKLHAKMAMRAI